MKTTAFFSLLFIFHTSICSSQTVDCNKFKTGKFYYPTIPNKISLRKDSTQESYNNGKLEMVWGVKWLNECKYELTCQQILVDPYPIHVGDRIIATIIKTNGDCFTTAIMYFNADNPNGQSFPAGELCIKKD